MAGDSTYSDYFYFPFYNYVPLQGHRRVNLAPCSSPGLWPVQTRNATVSIVMITIPAAGPRAVAQVRRRRARPECSNGIRDRGLK
jgi:hypothetical protein